MLVTFNPESYYPDGYADFLPNPHFHNADKGCNCFVQISNIGKKNSRRRVNVYCLTHNITCSKTGWELGWYLGNNNLATKGIRPKKLAIDK